jgi:capsular polysaccharide biosynthesis protein
MRLRHVRRRIPVDSFAADLTDPVRLAGSYAYLGICFGHFGHIMAEMIHRIVPTQQIVTDPHWLIVVDRGVGSGFEVLPSLTKAILALFGVNASNCTVIDHDAIVEDLLIVESGSDLGGGPKDWYLDLMRKAGPVTIAPDGRYPERIYVSRSGLGHESGFLGERVLEAGLANAGVHIMHSQTLPLVEQMAHYVNAKLLIFAEGSAVHGTELLGRGMLRHAVLMNRRDRPRTQFVPVLAGRSARLDNYAGNRYLGSVVHNPEGVPLEHRGVTAIALHAFAAFLKDVAALDIGAVSPVAYLAAAHDDLERYLALSPGPVDPLLADRLRAALCNVIEAGGTIAPQPPRQRRAQRAARR